MTLGGGKTQFVTNLKTIVKSEQSHHRVTHSNIEAQFSPCSLQMCSYKDQSLDDMLNNYH